MGNKLIYQLIVNSWLKRRARPYLTINLIESVTRNHN